MGKVFRPSNRESKILSQIESSKERGRRMAISSIQDNIEPLSNAIAMKLVEDKLVETTNKNGLQEQIKQCLDKLSHAEDFDVDYKVAPFRNIISQPNIVSLYVTAFVIETVINDKDVIDVFGSDEEIYSCINAQVSKRLP
jgi:hypothetical protein